jgi:thiamine-phosphate pyrophosphorylase
VLGCSTHTIEEALQAERDGADFVIFGPVFDTPGKSLPVGLEALRRVAEALRVPVLAIGGITQENAVEVVRVGAAGIAAIRMFQKR